MQEREQKPFWVGLVEYVCAEALVWTTGGAIWFLFFLADSYRRFTGVAAISCGTVILALVAWRALKADTEAVDDSDDNLHTPRLIDENRQRAPR
jgi:hypothetical protein